MDQNLPKDFYFFNPKKSSQLQAQHDKVLKIFLLLYFEFCQIWFNFLMDDHHLSNLTNWKGVWGGNIAYTLIIRKLWYYVCGTHTPKQK
jgi:hypothetical protein